MKTSKKLLSVALVLLMLAGCFGLCFSAAAAADYKLTYDANGGINPPSAQTYISAGERTITTYTPTREGYNFLGWSEDANATEAQYQPGGTIMVDRRITLYAVWLDSALPQYKLTYDANGGINPPSSQVYLSAGEKNISTFKPTREGYTFLGWASSPTATEAQYEAGGKITVNTRMTIYAVWKQNVADDQQNPGGGNQTPQASVCPWCGGDHSNGFFQMIVGWFHGIFASLFGAKY